MKLQLEKTKQESERIRGMGIQFNRLRRITGYLVPNLERWNPGKRAEEADRVKHQSMNELEDLAV